MKERGLSLSSTTLPIGAAPALGDRLPHRLRTVAARLLRTLSRHVEVARQREQLAHAPATDLGRTLGCRC